MRILFLSNVVPHPTGGGLPRRMASHLRALCTMGDVTLVIPSVLGKARPELPGVTVIERGPTLADQRLEQQKGSRSRLVRAWRSWRVLNMIDARANRSDAERFSRELAGPFDLVFAGRLGNAVWWESIAGRKPRPGEKRIVDFDDIESRMLDKYRATITVSPFWTSKLRREAVWLQKLERRISRTWDGTLLCSQIDAERLCQATGIEAWIVPNGYDLVPVVPEQTGRGCRLLFVGSFEYFPNLQGVEWFLEAIWPIVRQELGDDVSLMLVGLNAPDWVLALGQEPGIEVASSVPDVDPYYLGANLVIAPLRAGSGTRIKLIEAAAKGRAIVTTTLGCEGLGFEQGKHAEVADDPADFAARIVALARDPARRAKLAANARAHAEQAFSSDRIVADLAGKIARITREVAQ